MKALRALALLLVLGSMPVAAQSEDLEQYVVEIGTQDKVLIGSGTVVSYSGLVLTAKHVLRDTSEGEASSNYFARVLVRSKAAHAYEQADVIAVHPHLDVAVLQIQGAALAPMKIMDKTDGLATGTDITLIGHVKATNTLYQVKQTKIDQVARHGHIIAGRFVNKGTSGGPAIVDGRLVGVIRSTGDNSSTIVPIALTLDHLRLVGVIFSEDGLARRADDISALAARVQDYDRLLHEIQLDVAWTATLAVATAPQRTELSVAFERKLQAQPLFDAKLTIGAVPLFGGNDFARLPAEKRRGFILSDWVKNQAARLDASRDIEGVLNDYRADGLQLRAGDLVGFDLKAQVSSVIGEGFIRKRVEPFVVCFELRLKSGQKAAGGRCSEGLNYVNKLLPQAVF